MKNKLFLTLSLLTAGLNIQASATFGAVKQAIATVANPFTNTGRATLSGAIALPTAAVTGAYLTGFYPTPTKVKNFVTRQMNNASDVEAYGFIQSKQPSRFTKAMNFAKTSFNTSKTFVAKHKVATGAGLAAVVGLGLVYKYRKNIFGQAVKTTKPTVKSNYRGGRA